MHPGIEMHMLLKIVRFPSIFSKDDHNVMLRKILSVKVNDEIGKNCLITTEH